MPPTRRQLLQSAGVISLGVATGCLGDAGGGSGSDPTEDSEDTTEDTPNETTTEQPEDTTDMPDDTDTPTDEPTDTDAPDASTMSLANVDSAPDIPLEPAVEVTEADATQDHPPQVEITLSNTSDETVSAGEGRAIFFEHVTDETGALTFLPAENDYPAAPGCWRLSEPLMVTQEYRMERFDADESRSKRVDLYGASQGKGASGCLPTGEYRFETTIAVGKASGSDEDRTEATWGFSVILE
ncbi:hypothetical protein C453_11276 [Haloferax elongans ATCC BAA-1513]|uniref:Lipoprotein n=1 Tax=Haloferax elongans ATCC BAA-1513 TaxID=1230453 RepID=M0HLK9_HALEO|nr:hypothetical protein [Haloferax elongans]ELZ84592.1 hypothetical protein C453_11276 [Haloferax elongans ATCC BAA-1513]